MTQLLQCFYNVSVICTFQLRSLNLLLGVQEKLKCSEATETREKLSNAQLNSGILFDPEENSEDICKEVTSEVSGLSLTMSQDQPIRRRPIQSIKSVLFAG